MTETHASAATPRFKLSLTAQRWVVILAALTSILGLTISMGGLAPVLPAVVAGGFLFAILFTGNYAWIVHAMLIVLFTTTTPEIPRGVRVGGIFVYFHEFLIVGSLVYAIWLYRQNSAALKSFRRLFAVRAAFVFSISVALGLALALVRGYPFWDIQYDVKAVVEMIVVLFVAIVIVAIEDWRRYVKTIGAILIFSAALMVYASATGFVIWGRTETAELYAAGGRVIAGGSDAVRFLTQTTPLALAVLLGCVALLMVGRVRARHIIPLLIPALVISMLSFSRNSLLALAGTFMFVLLISVTNGFFTRVVLRLAVTPLIVTLLVIAFLGLGSALGAGGWINTQTTGYANRVIAGFDQSNERADTSAGYREQENNYIYTAGSEHPVFGGGFGTHYKPPSGKRGTFPAFEGTLYSHNAYNWFYLKIGMVGVIAFLLLIFACVLPALTGGGDNGLLTTASATLVGLSVAIVVTPMPIEQPGSALLGITMGLCVGATKLVSPSQHHRETVGELQASRVQT